MSTALLWPTVALAVIATAVQKKCRNPNVIFFSVTVHVREYHRVDISPLPNTVLLLYSCLSVLKTGRWHFDLLIKVIIVITTVICQGEEVVFISLIIFMDLLVAAPHSQSTIKYSAKVDGHGEETGKTVTGPSVMLH